MKKLIQKLKALVSKLTKKGKVNAKSRIAKRKAKLKKAKRARR